MHVARHMRRAAATASVITAAAVAPTVPLVAQGRSDEWLARPVDQRTFETFLPFFAYDRSVPLELTARLLDERDGIRREHLTFQSTPGVRVTAELSQPMTSPRSGAPAVILVHGGAAAGKNAPHYERLARFIASAGLNVLVADLQYFGERKTDLLTVFTEQEKHERLYNRASTYLAWVTQTAKEVGRAYDLLVQHRGADPRRIALVGFSRGAQLGMIVGAVDRRFAAVALLYGGHFDALETGHSAAACGANYIGRISPRPVLMMNGIHDNDYDRATSVLPLQRLLKEPKEVIWLDTGHQMPADEHLAALIRWLQNSLR
jgi:dienelactone hydrolase